MKGQVATEYLVIVSVALLILTPLSLYVNQSLMGYTDNTRTSKAWTAVNKLGQNADWVYSQGPPAKLTFQIYIPNGIEEASLDDKTFLLKVKTSAGFSDAYYTTVSNIDGHLPSESGYYYVSLTAFSNYVNVSVV